jgi:hypothetical protein
LWLIGRHDADQIERFKRTKKYTRDDFALLGRVLTPFRVIVTTPNILTELSNLAGQLSEPLRRDCLMTFAAIIAELEERYVTSTEIAGLDHSPRFGLTDGGVLRLAQDGRLVLTDDFPLANSLQSIGRDVLNFNHLRTIVWDIA